MRHFTRRRFSGIAQEDRVLYPLPEPTGGEGGRFILAHAGGRPHAECVEADSTLRLVERLGFLRLKDSVELLELSIFLQLQV